MAANSLLIFCLQILLIRSALSRCISSAPCYESLPIPTCGQFIPAASSGGSFVCTSSSPVAPTGVSIVSENLYEGTLVIGGDLPMLGSVGVEGEFPTSGAGAVSYGCGDDAVTLVEEGPVPTGILTPINYAPFGIMPGFAPYFGGYYGFGYGYGYPGFYGFGYPGYACY